MEDLGLKRPFGVGGAWRSTSASRLSLMMPTFNRHEFAIRNMRFWSGSGVQLHVLDGSAAPIDSSLRDFGANIHYHHLPLSFEERLAQGAAMIDTDYTAMVGDDEFFVPSALDACIAELDADSALSSCMGRALRFVTVDINVLATPAYVDMAGYTVGQDSGIERMIYHMHPYRVSSCYAVMRRDVWREAAGLMAARRFEHYAVPELQVELAAAYHGKSKVIPRLMWLRNGENPPVWSAGTQQRFPDWWSDASAAHQRRELITLIAAHLGRAGKDSLDELQAGVEAALDRFTAGYWIVRSPAGPPLVRQMRRVLQRASSLLPARTKDAVKRAVGLIKPLSGLFEPPPQPLRAAAADLAASGVIVDFEQLQEIERAISRSASLDH